MSKLKILLVIITSLPVLCILAYTVENIRGKWAWLAFREEWEARGETFDYRLRIPAPIPSEKNFAHTPLLKPLFESEYDEDFRTFTPVDAEKHEQAKGLLRGLLDFEDLESVVSKLKADGVKFRNDILDGVGGKQIICEDPFGNVIELTQPTR